MLPGGRVPGQLAPPITRNSDFYVVTKNADGDPSIHPQDWRLLIDGDVDHPVQLDYATLRKMPAVEFTKTLECISNYVGKPELAPFGAELIGRAVWKGVRVRDIFGVVGGLKSTVGWVAVLSADEFTSALPLEVVMDPNTMLVYEMNGEVLPREHGYPARLLVPGRYGMKNAKWVIGLRPLRREFTAWYGQRRAVAPVRGEWVLMLSVDDGRQPMTAGLIAHKPVGDPGQLAVGVLRAGLGHLGQAQAQGGNPLCGFRG